MPGHVYSGCRALGWRVISWGQGLFFSTSFVCHLISSHQFRKLTLYTHLSPNKGENHLLQIPTCTAGSWLPSLMVQRLHLAVCDDKVSIIPDSALTHAHSWCLTRVFFLLPEWGGEGEQEESSEWNSQIQQLKWSLAFPRAREIQP